MKVGDQEHVELLAMFERIHKGRRLDKEKRELWHIRQVYQDGVLNEKFVAFSEGYAFGRSVERCRSIGSRDDMLEAFERIAKSKADPFDYLINVSIIERLAKIAESAIAKATGAP